MGIEVVTFAIGIENSLGIIKTGAGDDTINGIAETTGEDTEVDIFATGFDNDQSFSSRPQSIVDVGDGNNTIAGTATTVAKSQQGSGNAQATGILNRGTMAEIRSGTGDDTIRGTAIAKVESGEDSATANALGIFNLDSGKIQTGDGNDIIMGSAEASASGTAMVEASAIGINNGSKEVETRNGDDIIMGSADAMAEGQEGSSTVSAIGISSFNSGEIRTGDGNDFVAGMATASGGGAVSTGILNGKIDLGRGHDTLIARASGTGVNLGVDNVLLDGGGGNDTFDLQNGNGTIIGGSGGQDRLILEGFKDDYAFTELASLSLGVAITNSDNLTNLTVSEVELFEFLGEPTMTYTYESVLTLS